MKALFLSKLVNPGRDAKKRLNWNAALDMLQSPEYIAINKMCGGDILFSLEGFDYLNADGLLWLLLIGDEMRSRGNSLWLELPRKDEQLAYLKTSRFYRIASELFFVTNVFHMDEVGSTLARRSAMTFFRVTIESLPPLMQQLGAFLIQDFHKKLDIENYGYLSLEGIPTFQQLIFEMSKNIVQHSRNDLNRGWGYFIVEQVGRNALQFCIGDAGRGFLSSIRSKTVGPDNDTDAIRRALLYRYFRPEGEGLFRVMQFISHLKGTVRIRSGNGAAYLNLTGCILDNDQKTKEFIEESIQDRCTPLFFPGVQFKVELRRQ